MYTYCPFNVAMYRGFISVPEPGPWYCSWFTAFLVPNILLVWFQLLHVKDMFLFSSPMLNVSLVLPQILNFFLALLLSSFTGDYLVPDEKEKNNLQIAIDQIKKAMGRTSTCRDPKCRSYSFSLFSLLLLEFCCLMFSFQSFSVSDESLKTTVDSTLLGPVHLKPDFLIL